MRFFMTHEIVIIRELKKYIISNKYIICNSRENMIKHNDKVQPLYLGVSPKLRSAFYGRGSNSTRGSVREITESISLPESRS